MVLRDVISFILDVRTRTRSFTMANGPSLNPILEGDENYISNNIFYYIYTVLKRFEEQRRYNALPKTRKDIYCYKVRAFLGQPFRVHEMVEM